MSRTAVLLAFCLCQLTFVNAGSRCPEGWYFGAAKAEDNTVVGVCIGYPQMNLRIPYEKQYYEYENKTFCTNRYPNARNVEPLVVRSKAHVSALRKLIKTSNIPFAYIGWEPRRHYEIGPVRKVVDPTTLTVLQAKNLTQQLKSAVFFGNECDADDYSTDRVLPWAWKGGNRYDGYEAPDDWNSTSWEREDYGEYESTAFYQGLSSDEYSSAAWKDNKNEDYGSSDTYLNLRSDSASSSEDQDEYTATGTDNSYTDSKSGYSSDLYSSFYKTDSRKCYYGYPLIMTKKGRLSVIKDTYGRAKMEMGKRGPAICMYAVPSKEETATCPELVGEGSCLFANPLNVSDTQYTGDNFGLSDISLSECINRCQKNSFCLSFGFSGESSSSGTCLIYSDTPVSVNATSVAASKVSYCAAMQASSSSSCTSSLPNWATLSPTPKPTMNPTPRPTKSPTPAPTSRPTKPTPAPTQSVLPDNVDAYPSCPNNMILAQCYRPSCEKECGGTKLSAKCSSSAERVCITLPDPQENYTYAEEKAFLETYCRCEDGDIFDSASLKCVTKASQCPNLLSTSWSDKCLIDEDNSIVDLQVSGETVTLSTNEDAAKYSSNADICWIIRAPNGGTIGLVVDGTTQKKKDVLEVYDVLSPSLANFTTLKASSVDTMLRDTYSGDVSDVALDAQAQQMVIYFRSNPSNNKAGLSIKATLTSESS
mmetsp:Transcript_12355/g.24016  ORF Transcript_12355/g.24016 Transcript_12355/m.24016 type:complete len:705 (-) Transcript_12355:5-2119(-)